MHTIPRSTPPLDPKKVTKIETLVEDLLQDVPPLPTEKHIEEFFNGVYKSAKQQKQQR
jgi:hypothetical protein